MDPTASHLQEITEFFFLGLLLSEIVTKSAMNKLPGSSLEWRRYISLMEFFRRRIEAWDSRKSGPCETDERNGIAHASAEIRPSVYGLESVDLIQSILLKVESERLEEKERWGLIAWEVRRGVRVPRLDRPIVLDEHGPRRSTPIIFNHEDICHTDDREPVSSLHLLLFSSPQSESPSVRLLTATQVNIVAHHGQRRPTAFLALKRKYSKLYLRRNSSEEEMFFGF